MARSSAAAGQFDEFYRGTAQRTVRYAVALTGELAIAQDLTQEAYIRAWQRWSTVAGLDNAEAWLRVVVTRLAKDRWRALGVRRRYHQAARPQPPTSPPDETTLLITAALRRLPLAQRRALAMHYLFDLPITQIAAETGTPEGTVRSLLSRGRAALAGLLTDAYPEVRDNA